MTRRPNFSQDSLKHTLPHVSRLILSKASLLLYDSNKELEENVIFTR